MSARSVGAVVRARAAASRRVGAGRVPSLAASSGLPEALSRLATGPYGHDVRPGQPLSRAQHEVYATLLWNLRVLAGWLPPDGAQAMRLLAGWAEIANVDALLRRLDGDRDLPPAYRLGSLATAWPRLADSTDRAEPALASWPPRRGATPAARTTTPSPWSCAWCGRPACAAACRPPPVWAAGAAALVLALDLCAGPHPHDATVTAAVARVLGRDAAAATTLADLRAALPSTARWALAGCDAPEDLWRAEAAWWLRVERDATAMTRSSASTPPPSWAWSALLAVDAWRVRAALELRRARRRRRRRSMPSSDRLGPVAMRRIALVAPRPTLRALLVQVAAAGVVEVETAAVTDAPGRTRGPRACSGWARRERRPR